jgi:hypothetical protein
VLNLVQEQYQFLVNVLGGFAAWQKAGWHVRRPPINLQTRMYHTVMFITLDKLRGHKLAGMQGCQWRTTSAGWGRRTCEAASSSK